MRNKFLALSSLLVLGLIAHADVTGTYKGSISIKDSEMKASMVAAAKKMGKPATDAQINQQIQMAKQFMTKLSITLTLNKGGKGTIAQSMGGQGGAKTEPISWTQSGNVVTIKSKDKPMKGRVSADQKTITVSSSDNPDMTKGGQPAMTITFKK